MKIITNALLIVFTMISVGCIDRESKEESKNPYPTNINYEKKIKHALTKLNANQHLLLIFGANWCPTCRKVDASLKQRDISNYLINNYIVIKVNIGRFDKNLNIAHQYGSPIKQGIPAISVVNNDGSVYKTFDAFTLSAQHKKGRKSFSKFIKNIQLN